MNNNDLGVWLIDEYIAANEQTPFDIHPAKHIIQKLHALPTIHNAETSSFFA
jgi:hypothetical protein